MPSTTPTSQTCTQPDWSLCRPGRRPAWVASPSGPAPGARLFFTRVAAAAAARLGCSSADDQGPACRHQERNEATLPTRVVRAAPGQDGAWWSHHHGLPRASGRQGSPLDGTQLWTRLQAIDISAIRKDYATSRKSITKALLERSCHHALPRRGPRRHRRDGKRPTGHEGLAPGARRGGPWRGARRCAGSTAAAAGCDMPALLRCYAAPRLCDARSSASRPRSRATPPRGHPRRPRTQSGRSTPATAWSPRPPSSGTWCTRGVTMATSSRSTQPRERSCGPMPPAGRFARARPCSPTGPSSLAATTAPCTTCPPRALC